VAQRFRRKLPTAKWMSNQPALWTPDTYISSPGWQLNTWTVTGLTTAKFKPLLLPTHHILVHLHVYLDLDDFGSLLPAYYINLIYIIIHVGNFESHLQLVERCAPVSVANSTENSCSADAAVSWGEVLGGRTIYSTLSAKRTPFQTGTNMWPHLWMVLRKRWISHIHPMWLCGHSLFKILSLWPVFLWKQVTTIMPP
jgi:hypothetical protein